MPDPTLSVPDDFALLYDERALARIERQRIERDRIDALLGEALHEGEGDGEGASPWEPDDGGDVLVEDDHEPSGRAAAALVKRYGLVGAMGAASMLGLGEVLEPEGSKPTIIEFAPDALNEDEQLVTFLMVPGDPQASRLIIRPWLRRR